MKLQSSQGAEVYLEVCACVHWILQAVSPALMSFLALASESQRYISYEHNCKRRLKE
jgi:hypothetical protein